MTAGGERDGPVLSALLNLPARLGGVRVLSHKDCAPLARQAAAAEADITILGPAREREAREGTDAVAYRSSAPSRASALLHFGIT